jgi:hypothetical protein
LLRGEVKGCGGGSQSGTGSGREQAPF